VATVGSSPGTFNPPTVAHLAIAEAARDQGGVDRVELVVSEMPLGKEPTVPTLADRVSVLEAMAASRAWLGVRVTPRTLIAELAEGYDAVVVGADKWLQVVDPAWYGGSPAARDQAVASLPRVLLVPRTGYVLPAELPDGAVILDVDAAHGAVSSTEVRAGRLDWMVAEAAAYARATGAWTDPGVAGKYPGSGEGSPFQAGGGD